MSSYDNIADLLLSPKFMFIGAAPCIEFLPAIVIGDAPITIKSIYAKDEPCGIARGPFGTALIIPYLEGNDPLHQVNMLQVHTERGLMRKYRGAKEICHYLNSISKGLFHVTFKYTPALMFALSWKNGDPTD
jgi:hypothetical protein